MCVDLVIAIGTSKRLWICVQSANRLLNRRRGFINGDQRLDKLNACLQHDGFLQNETTCGVSSFSLFQVSRLRFMASQSAEQPFHHLCVWAEATVSSPVSRSVTIGSCLNGSVSTGQSTLALCWQCERQMGEQQVGNQCGARTQTYINSRSVQNQISQKAVFLNVRNKTYEALQIIKKYKCKCEHSVLFLCRIYALLHSKVYAGQIFHLDFFRLSVIGGLNFNLTRWALCAASEMKCNLTFPAGQFMQMLPPCAPVCLRGVGRICHPACLTGCALMWMRKDKRGGGKWASPSPSPWPPLSWQWGG